MADISIADVGSSNNSTANSCIVGIGNANIANSNIANANIANADIVNVDIVNADIVNIGITGSRGFLGSHLLNELAKEHSVEGFDLGDDIDSFVKDKDIIFHLAGVNRGTDEEQIKGNTQLTNQLIEAIRNHGKKNTRIIYSSTFWVYGDTEGDLDEQTRPRIQNKHSETKIQAEDAIRQSGYDYVIFRLSNVYGPGCKPYYNSVIATFIDLIRNNKPLLVYNSGKQAKDFVFVDDVISGLLMGLNVPKGVYNICTGKTTSIMQIISALENLTGNKAQIENKETDEKIIIAKGVNTKLKSFGWKPRIDFMEGLKKCL